MVPALRTMADFALIVFEINNQSSEQLSPTNKPQLVLLTLHIITMVIKGQRLAVLLFCQFIRAEIIINITWMNRVLLPEFPGNNLLFHAISNGNTIDAVNLLQNKEAQVNAQNVNGASPLHIAVIIQNINLAKLLLKFGANVNLQEYHDIGEKTPLHYAVEKNNYELTSLLLDNGASTTVGDKRGLTPLHYAARFGYKEIIKLLVAQGADINLRDNSGFNAAHWAKMNEFGEIVEMIGPARSIAPNDYQEYKKAMIQIHQINLKKKKKKGKKKK